MADAYKVLHDTSFPRPIRTSTTSEGVTIEETTGQAYATGDYVLAEELTESVREAAENGDFEGTLEEASTDDVEQARRYAETGLFIPEHEVERYALIEAGHRIIERDQVLELRAAGADAAKEYVEAARDSEPEGGDPAITEQQSFVEMPSLAEVSPSDSDARNVPIGGKGKQDEVDPEEVAAAGTELPPGLPVGHVLVQAEGGEVESSSSPEEPAAPAARTARRKPGGETSPAVNPPSESGA